MTDFFPSSELAKARVVRKMKYPWYGCIVGSSFAVPREQVKFSSLLSMATKMSKKLKTRFVVVDHGSGAYEVANIGAKVENN